MTEIIPTEEQEQLALVQWLELHKIRYTHVPNEGKHKVQYLSLIHICGKNA